MSSFYKNILVPVDFTFNSEVAIKKAIELCRSSNSTIHLLHVIKPNNLADKFFGHQFNAAFQVDKEELSLTSRKLQEWQAAIEETVPQCRVKICVLQGSVCRKTRDVARKVKPELIIIARTGGARKHTHINANWLAEATDSPVLDLVSGTAIHQRIKTILIPVRSFVPCRKIELAATFAIRQRAKIHLVSLANKFGRWNNDRNHLLETYSILRTVLTNPIELHTVCSNNFPKATFEYAEQIAADMVLVNPTVESRVSSYPNMDINNLLTSSSKIQILSVKPYV